MKKEPVFTEEGFKQLKKEHRHLVEEKRPQILEKLREAREMGNPEDNLQYEAVKLELELTDARIKELEELIQEGKIVPKKEVSGVDVGSEVVVEIEGETEKFIIVSPYESNPNKGKISYESPVGKALMGSEEGEEVEVSLPHATIGYRIVEINYHE